MMSLVPSHSCLRPCAGVEHLLSAIATMRDVSIEVVDTLAMMREAADTQANIFNQVLSLAAMESQSFSLVNQRWDIREILHGAVDQIHLWATNVGAVVTLHVAGDVPRFVVLDKQRFLQVISNLLSNAVKAIDEYHHQEASNGGRRADGREPGMIIVCARVINQHEAHLLIRGSGRVATAHHHTRTRSGDAHIHGRKRKSPAAARVQPTGALETPVGRPAPSNGTAMSAGGGADDRSRTSIQPSAPPPTAPVASVHPPAPSIATDPARGIGDLRLNGGSRHAPLPASPLTAYPGASPAAFASNSSSSSDPSRKAQRAERSCVGADVSVSTSAVSSSPASPASSVDSSTFESSDAGAAFDAAIEFDRERASGLAHLRSIPEHGSSHHHHRHHEHHQHHRRHRSQPQYLLFEVTDNGEGINEGDQQNIFKPFVQINPDGKAVTGTGLALAIGSHIVAAHGGRIGFSSCSARAQFPTATPVSASAAAAAASASAGTSAAGCAQSRVTGRNDDSTPAAAAQAPAARALQHGTHFWFTIPLCLNEDGKDDDDDDDGDIGNVAGAGADGEHENYVPAPIPTPVAATSVRQISSTPTAMQHRGEATAESRLRQLGQQAPARLASLPPPGPAVGTAALVSEIDTAPRPVPASSSSDGVSTPASGSTGSSSHAPPPAASSSAAAAESRTRWFATPRTAAASVHRPASPSPLRRPVSVLAPAPAASSSPLGTASAAGPDDGGVATRRPDLSERTSAPAATVNAASTAAGDYTPASIVSAATAAAVTGQGMMQTNSDALVSGTSSSAAPGGGCASASPDQAVPTRLAHFLVADDAPSNRKMLARLVKSRFSKAFNDSSANVDGGSSGDAGTTCAGGVVRLVVDVDEAANGEAALQHMQAHMHTHDGGTEYYDAIFMDAQMPVMDGYEATRRIRAARLSTDVGQADVVTGPTAGDGDGDGIGATGLGYRGLILGVTGNALDEDVRAFMEAGVDDVVTKPVDMARLSGLVLDHMGLQDVTARQQ